MTDNLTHSGDTAKTAGNDLSGAGIAFIRKHEHLSLDNIASD